jgi:hypothetical protein
MHANNPRSVIVAFKVEPELAGLLNQLPNKSAFIRKAIAAQLGVCCPLCKGSGHVRRWVHDHYAPLIVANRNHPCDGCGGEMPVPDDTGELAPEDRDRLEQFFRGGPLYCDTCYRTAPPCDECGWHIGDDRIGEHKRVAHTVENGVPRIG